MTRPLQLFVVDDSQSDLLLAEEAFADFREQVSVRTYLNGQAALEAMLRPNAVLPDILLLDINMPQMGGFELLKVLKAHDQLKFIPVVMLTTSMAPQDVAQAYALFASSYVVKPVDLSSFFQQIKSFVEFWTKARLPNWPTPAAVEDDSPSSR